MEAKTAVRQRAYRVRYGEPGGDSYFHDFCDKTVAKAQLKILRDQIKHDELKELYAERYIRVMLKVPSDSTRKKKRRQKKKRKRADSSSDEDERSIDDQYSNKHGVKEFLDAYADGRIRPDVKALLIDESESGYYCTAAAAYEAICHSEAFFKPTVDSLKHWHKNHDKPRAILEIIKPDNEIVHSTEEFCVEKNYEYSVC